MRSQRPAKTALRRFPRGSTAVTPVRAKGLSTGVSADGSPVISVLYPTSTPATSVMAL